MNMEHGMMNMEVIIIIPCSMFDVHNFVYAIRPAQGFTRGYEYLSPPGTVRQKNRSFWERFNILFIGGSILVFVKKEIFFGRIIRPYILNAFVHFAFVLDLPQVLDYLLRCPGPDAEIDQFFLGGGPGSVLQFRS
jgi:hypothetical protein